MSSTTARRSDTVLAAAPSGSLLRQGWQQQWHGINGSEVRADGKQEARRQAAGSGGGGSGGGGAPGCKCATASQQRQCCCSCYCRQRGPLRLCGAVPACRSHGARCSAVSVARCREQWCVTWSGDTHDAREEPDRALRRASLSAKSCLANLQRTIKRMDLKSAQHQVTWPWMKRGMDGAPRRRAGGALQCHPARSSLQQVPTLHSADVQLARGKDYGDMLS